MINVIVKHKHIFLHLRIRVSPLVAVQPSAGLWLRLLPSSGSALLFRGHIGCPRGTGNGQYANCGHAKRAICCLLNRAQLRQQCNTAVWCLIKITAYLTSSRGKTLQSNHHFSMHCNAVGICIFASFLFSFLLIMSLLAQTP